MKELLSSAEVLCAYNPTIPLTLACEFTSGNGIIHRMGAPYHPQSKGLAEQMVQSVKNALLKMEAKYQVGDAVYCRDYRPGHPKWQPNRKENRHFPLHRPMWGNAYQAACGPALKKPVSC